MSHDHTPKGLKRWICSTNHKDIGLLYLYLSIFGGIVGSLFSVIFRMELMQPGSQIFLYRLWQRTVTYIRRRIAFQRAFWRSFRKRFPISIRGVKRIWVKGKRLEYSDRPFRRGKSSYRKTGSVPMWQTTGFSSSFEATLRAKYFKANRWVKYSWIIENKRY